MDKLSINLLPEDILEEERKQIKIPWLNSVTIGALLLTVGVTVSVFIFSVAQNRAFARLNDQVKEARDKVASFRETESLVLVLKSRLNKISSLSPHESVYTQSYNLITSLVTSEIEVTGFSVDKSGKILLGVSFQDPSRLQPFFANLTDPARNEGKIKSVRIDGLSKGRTGNIKMDLIIFFSQQGGVN